MKKLLLGITLALICNSTHAVELTSRMGIGLSQQVTTIDIPMITVHYHPNSRFGTSLAVGMDTEDNASKLGALAKVYQIIFTEQNMNFYMGAALGFTNYESRNGATAVLEDKSTVNAAALIGGEFFFTGLDSLGFTFETGVSITTGDDGTRFQTLADNPFRAGIVFYF